MSFCIAKIIDGQIFIHVDSLLTGEGVVRHQTEKDTILKAVLMNHQFCLMYAGNVEVANVLIKKIFELPRMPFKNLVNLILADHINNDLVTDYIIVTCFNRTPRIIEIKNSQLKETQSSWIGSDIAFNSFQNHFITLKNENQPLSETFRNAFSRVIVDQNVPDVGGFHFSIQPITKTKVYRGNPMLMNYPPQLIMHVVNIDFLKKYGYIDSSDSKKSTGGFAYTILPSATFEFPGFGIHFGHVNVGMLYIPKLYGIYPETYYDCTGHQFVEIANQKGITLSGMTMDNETSIGSVHKGS